MWGENNNSLYKKQPYTKSMTHLLQIVPRGHDDEHLRATTHVHHELTFL
jgi:hypothetical protein